MSLPHQIGIIGLGLIGGSIAKALKKHVPNVVIGSLERECGDLQAAVKSGVVDTLFSSWEELIGWSQLIILASPLSTLSLCAWEIAKRCPERKNLIVIDVGSVKKAVFPCFETWTQGPLEFLSTHPMAGKEKWGFENSDADLFQERCWILSPHSKNKDSTLEMISRLVCALGGQPTAIDPKEHDEQVALISHFPALLSCLLLKFVETKNKESLKLAGPGFQSMTRLSHDNPQMQKEIATFNRDELRKLLKLFLEFIREENP